MHQRIGWLVLNTQRPPGRSTRATSRITAALSVTKGIAPKAEQAMSTLASARGSADASACTSSGPRSGVALHRLLGMPQLPGGQVERDDVGALRDEPAARTAPRRSRPRGSRRPRSESAGPSSRDRLLAQALGAPDEVRGGRIAGRSGQEVAVLGLVGVGLVVPPATGSPRRQRAGPPRRSRR